MWINKGVLLSINFPLKSTLLGEVRNFLEYPVSSCYQLRHGCNPVTSEPGHKEPIV